MKKVWITLAVAMLAGCNAAQAVEPNEKSEHQKESKLPAWSEFNELLGQSIDSEVVQKFVALYELKKYAKGSSGGFDNYYKIPFSPLFSENKIDRVVVTISNYAGFNRPIYTPELPYGILHTDTPDDVIGRLGTPESRSKNEWLLYKKLGLWLSFNRKTEKLAEIDLDDLARWKE